VRYQQVCPVSLASEVIAERWTPLILREIVLFGARRFGDIQRGTGRISQSLLVQRLRTLEIAGVIERRANPAGRGWEYHPTQAGRELEPVLEAFGEWAQHWVELRREDCDPAYLMLTVQSLLDPARLPAAIVTVRFEFLRHPKIYWLVCEAPEPELCYDDPGRIVDLVVTVDEQVFGEVLIGRRSFHAAVEDGSIRLDGEPALARAFPGWLWPSHFARYAKPDHATSQPLA
jgi:DNA-binding HxlR family transcriptional regulator